MADEKPANAPGPEGPGGEHEPPQVSLPSRDPLPLPPQVTYTRPKLGRPAPSASAPRTDRSSGQAPESRGDTGLTKLGAGMAAATTFVASVVAGLLIGQWVDHRWGHPGQTPWGMLIFSLLGVAAGFLNLFRVLAATDRTRKK